MLLLLIDRLLSTIAPHQCVGCGRDGALLCAACQTLLPQAMPRCYRCGATKDGAKTCNTCRQASPLAAVRTYAEYEGIAEVLVRRLKFERSIAAGPIITQYLQELLSPTLDNVVLVPVPTATHRVRIRGYDQSVLLARLLAKQTGLPCKELLERHGQQRQTGSGRSARVRQLDDAFVPASRKTVPNTVVLIDDVLTTGATLESAATALRKAGVKEISALTFARAV